MTACFDFFGLTVQVTSPGSQLIDEVRRDFSHFEGPLDTPRLKIEMHSAPAPPGTLPDMRASLISPRNVCYKHGRRKYLDYFGRGWAVVDDEDRSCSVYSEDADLAHEIVYLYLLSTVGAHLDAKGLHRLHALGVSHSDRGFLLLLPSGGGKSTMALELMRRPGFLLLSEDTPLIDRHGEIHPFPLRLGIRPGEEGDIPPEYVRTMNRMEFDPKTLIDLDYIRDRLGGTVPPEAILVGERSTALHSEIVPLSRRGAALAVVKNLVVGLGVYQGIEFVLEQGLSELFGQTGVALSRSLAGGQLLRRAPAFKFVLGRDRARNTRCFLDFVQRRIGAVDVSENERIGTVELPDDAGA